jgi:putative ABC transport system permease protein
VTLKNTFRIIRRDSLTLITNMTGLSLGLAASILLTVFIQFELSFDRYFSNSDRIFRLNSIWINGGERMIMPINLRKAYQREVIHGENRHKNLVLLYADPGFFQLFDLKPVEGNLQVTLPDRLRANHW